MIKFDRKKIKNHYVVFNRIRHENQGKKIERSEDKKKEHCNTSSSQSSGSPCQDDS